MKKLTVVCLALTLLALPALAGEEGAATYKAKCAMCHGADGASDTPMGKRIAAPDLRVEAVQSKDDAALIEVITKGKSKKWKGCPYERSDAKKAIVRLKAGDSIDITSGI